MTKQEFDNCLFQQEDPHPEQERRDKSDTRAFWFLWIPLGAVVGFFACVVGDSGGFFLPVWGVTTLLLWGMFGRSSE
jgi:hypothetical protein